MTDRRRTDVDARQRWMRCGSRVFEAKGMWYFQTREGSVEGPYADRYSAERVLEGYVKVMGSPFATTTTFSLVDDEAGRPRSVESPDLGIGRLVRQR